MRVFQTILPLGRERNHLHQGAAGRHAVHGPEPNRGRAARPRHGGQGVQTYYLVTGYTHGVSSLSFSIASSFTSLLPH